MIIAKELRMDDYILEIRVSSNTLHAHSLLSDNKEAIEQELYRVQRTINDLIFNHRAKYIKQQEEKSE